MLKEIVVTEIEFSLRSYCDRNVSLYKSDGDSIIFVQGLTGMATVFTGRESDNNSKCEDV